MGRAVDIPLLLGTRPFLNTVSQVPEEHGQSIDNMNTNTLRHWRLDGSTTRVQYP